MLIPISPLTFRGLHRVPALPTFAFPVQHVEAGGTSVETSFGATCMGEQFRKDFLGWTEGPSEPETLRENYLKMDAHDCKTDRTCGILEDLGGLSWAPITIGQFWYLLSILGRQRRFIAYVRRGDTVVFVGASWIYEGRQTIVKSLYVESGPVNVRSKGAGAYVLSR